MVCKNTIPSMLVGGLEVLRFPFLVILSNCHDLTIFKASFQKPICSEVQLKELFKIRWEGTVTILLKT
jgi:hypothetical protein